MFLHELVGVWKLTMNGGKDNDQPSIAVYNISCKWQIGLGANFRVIGVAEVRFLKRYLVHVLHKTQIRFCGPGAKLTENT